MNSEDFDNVVEGLRDATAWKKGIREGFVTHAPSATDGLVIRKTHNQTQEDFTKTSGATSVRD